jgi:hypothetical protein
VKATAFPTKGKQVHLMNLRHDVDELFDLDPPKQTTMKIEDLANQLIHSYIFYLMTEEGEFNGFWSPQIASAIRNCFRSPRST